MIALPWAPLFSVERGGRPDITHYGLMAIWDNASGNLLAHAGDVDFPIWSRSLLKPWQLLSILPTLIFHYQLAPEQVALMMSSHNAEPLHREILAELLTMGHLQESDLQCGAGYSMSDEVTAELKAQGLPPSRLYCPCSGKHAGFLLALKAANLPIDNYLDPSGPFYRTLRDILGTLLERDAQSFEVTVDGCRMPNYALSAREIAQLYGGLIQPVDANLLAEAPAHVRDSLKHMGDIPLLMRNHPSIVGGTGRLDTRLIKGGPATTPEPGTSRTVKLVAKEGADGLLGVCVTTAPGYPHGLGMLLKLAEGYNPALMEQLVKEVFRQLGISLFPTLPEAEDGVVKTRYHFQVKATAPI